MPVAEETRLLHRDLRALGVKTQMARALHGVGLVDQFVCLRQATALCCHDRRGHQQQTPFFGLDVASAARAARLEKRFGLGELLDLLCQVCEMDAQLPLQRRRRRRGQ